MRKSIIGGLAVLLGWPLLALADLTGVWKGNDGGTYYITQRGDSVSWYGESSPTNPAWSNVFHGRLRGNRIEGDWTDVPKGRTRSRGELLLEVRPGEDVLLAQRRTGGFGGSRWTRVGQAPPVAGVSEDCVDFNPVTAQLAQVQGRWKIVDGSHWVFDFGNKQGEGRDALRVIKHYGVNQSCYVGRPGPSFEYLLVSGRAPMGALSGEDCVGFDPASAEVRNVGGRWKIVDGSHMMFDFGSKRDEARKALAIIKKHGFTRSCFVGRPDPSFKYLRR